MFLPWRLPISDDQHEQVFIERLSKVLHWAHQITGGDAALAEDLAQDAFLHFTAGRPPLQGISNIDKYLYVVLKNLFRSHLASVSRRRTVPFDPLAHENAMQTWRSADPERRLTVRDDLRRICLFVCERKETSKGASAFLLHFFHGLSLFDVSLVMQTTRGAVDERLSVIRKEARHWLHRPAPVLVRSGSDEADLMAELQSAIASTCHGDCFSADEVRRRYAPGASDLPKDRLAHLASCSKCLRLISELLQFPRDPGSTPTATPGDRDRLSRWQRNRAALFSMEPSELRLIVNGNLLATERVNGPDNNFSVAVVLREPLEFVEIWGDETTRLLFLCGISEPPDGKFEQEASLQLNGRRLQLNLRFTEPWPTIAINYQCRPNEHLSEVREPELVSSADTVLLRGKRSENRRFWRFSTPTFSTAIAIALIILLLFIPATETTLSASELLIRAEKWQQRITTTRTPVLHRRFSLTKQRSGGPAQRTFVDVWRREDARIKLSRWTDESGRVLSEVSRPLSQFPPVKEETIWQFEPSADAFVAAAGPLGRAAVVTAGDHTIIRIGSAELVLDRATNRPVEERLSLEMGEYVFSESSTETIPVAASPLFRASANSSSIDKRLRASIEPRRTVSPPAGVESKAEERELQVRRELHALQLATAATVIKNGTTIDVRLAPTSLEQEQQLRSALGRILGVNISILNTKAAVLDAVAINNPPTGATSSAKLREPLASKWLKLFFNTDSEVHAEEVRRVEAGQRLVSCAAEWRLLAERYPVNVERELSLEARATLAEIVDDLRAKIRRDLDDERNAISVLLQYAADLPIAAPSDPPCQSWESQAIRAADLVWEHEQAIEKFYAPIASDGVLLSDADTLLKLRNLSSSLDSVLRNSCSHK